MNTPGKRRGLVAALITIITAVGIVIVVDSGTDEQGHPHRTITVTLGGAHRLDPSAPAQTVTLAPPAQAIAAAQKQQDAAGNDQGAHSDLRSEPPAASSPATLEQDEALKPSGQPTPPARVPLATVEQPGCRTLLVRNYSSRQGSPILLGVLHATISADNGWSGVLGNVKWFDSSAAQASSNYIVARSGGQCAYIVPETSKAWAQAGFNRVALSIEVTETLREGSYLPKGPGRARVIALMRAFHQRWKIPYRHGRVSGCTVTRTGFVEHADLGSCGGSHVDVNPYGIDDLIRQAAAGAGPTASVATDCRHVAAWRKRYPRGRGSSASSRAHIRDHLAHAKAAGYSCPVGSAKPVKG